MDDDAAIVTVVVDLDDRYQRILDAGFQIVDVLAVHANLPFTQNAPGSEFQIDVRLPVQWLSGKQ